ncbi:MAG: radical SAM protein [Methanomicrobiales archaeon]|nr:radical SAM protein [Methanomicrobiales archaeon]
MTSEAVIIDGYVDEPACFGVPPYLSPYVRYAAGVFAEHGYRTTYVTIDTLRKDPGRFSRFNDAAVVLVIAGVTVPGKYLGGTPATMTEIRQIAGTLRRPEVLAGGPVTFGYAPGGGQKAVRQALTGCDAVLEGDIASALDAHLGGSERRNALDYSAIDRWSVAGAAIVAQHPSYPHVMLELETARGCARGVTGGCSFCTEPLYGPPRYRSPEGIEDEVRALAAAGARHFRLGRQPDLLTYGATGGEFPAPRPDRLRALFAGIRRAAPNLATLHIDNINPGTIARHEDAAREALAEIVRGHTPGDTAAFGMETADPAVIAANNLKASPDEVFRAIGIVNEIGGGRKHGVPDLLPGLNFVIGLAGETPDTFARNEAFLQRVLDAGLMVRRVNIRQLMPFEGTPAYDDNTLDRHARLFARFKEHVRTEFDAPMLRRVFPEGTVLSGVIVEVAGTPSFGRQMGSYPILCGFPLRLPERFVTDAVVVGWGMRSVTVLPFPVRINDLPAAALRWLPGIGKKRAAAIAARRPFGTLAEFRAVVGETPLEAQYVF